MHVRCEQIPKILLDILNLNVRLFCVWDNIGSVDTFGGVLWVIVDGLQVSVVLADGWFRGGFIQGTASVAWDYFDSVLLVHGDHWEVKALEKMLDTWLLLAEVCI